MTTDVLACLVLLGQQESQCRGNNVHVVSPSRTSSKLSPPAWMNVSRARHYMRFALAAFGWPMYILPSPQLIRSMWRIYHVSRYTARCNNSCSYALLRPAVSSVITPLFYIVCLLRPAVSSVITPLFYIVCLSPK